MRIIMLSLEDIGDIWYNLGQCVHLTDLSLSTNSQTMSLLSLLQHCRQLKKLTVTQCLIHSPLQLPGHTSPLSSLTLCAVNFNYKDLTGLLAWLSCLVCLDIINCVALEVASPPTIEWHIPNANMSIAIENLQLTTGPVHRPSQAPHQVTVLNSQTNRSHSWLSW
ncbi:hypothetical protein DM01DRAFT_1333357 [Hesseltinella vesiculosa]|uniref:RNI-like protein n=1 Tax=Hesseltinella vesiculosa TaxID=101127 RepID=A0A1X2GPR0_9FUNG|nr:hypothetical protein DM01DRAFT_1333357 [Hesseltinella vesiculosa]